ncbi:MULTISPECIES: hypothetical protein [Rhodococcus]|uniref:hypothetical protein n=1 Tax=Rhodococcus TaxID=1827 RepID=UPI001CF8EA94|nr:MULTISPECIES: hypothetical protein [Rhodococcus]
MPHRPATRHPIAHTTATTPHTTATTRHATAFTGRITIDPPLQRAEIDFLTAFAGPRSGPHRAPCDGLPARGRPLSWCQWVPTPDGTALVWDGNAPFYLADRWMRYLIDTFLSPRARMRRVLRGRRNEFPDELARFAFDHVLDGSIRVLEDDRVVSRISVRRNTVRFEGGGGECVAALFPPRTSSALLRPRTDGS